MDKEIPPDASDLRQKELEEISSKISDLDKWRKIFSWRGLEVSHTTHQKCQDPKPDDDKEDAAGATTSSLKQDQFPSHSLDSIPQTLLVSSNLGGQPISLEMAVGLRKMLFGSTFQDFSYEWKKAYFRFHEPGADLAYALEMDKGGAIAIQMAVQVNVIKNLLFVQNKEENTHLQSLCELNQKEQERSLVAALTDILWTAGEGQKATICLVSNDTYLTPSIDYKADNLTERVRLFDFFEKEAAEKFLCDRIHCVGLGDGFTTDASSQISVPLEKTAALKVDSKTLLHTLTDALPTTFNELSNRFQVDFAISGSKIQSARLQKDLDFTTTHLLQFRLGSFICRQAILNIILTGRASPHVFNGIQKLDTEGSAYKLLHGVLSRSDVGYLHWSKDEVENHQPLQVGSMLKTPKLPIWLCNVNGTYSVLFSTNRLLLSDWKMEHLFDLYFYTGQPSQKTTVRLTVDTHSHHWEEKQCGEESNAEKRAPSVDMAIRTKWEGAAINWNGIIPFW